jgi:inner membrane protein
MLAHYRHTKHRKTKRGVHNNASNLLNLNGARGGKIQDFKSCASTYSATPSTLKKIHEFDAIFNGANSTFSINGLSVCYNSLNRRKGKRMEEYGWIVWTMVGVAMIIAEIFTLGFVLLWFGIGALAAGIASFLGFGYLVQFLVFAFVSVTLTLFSRKIFSSKFEEINGLKTGIDSLPGQIGTVTISGKGSLGEGAVKVYGSVWTAFPEEGETLIKGEKVEVTRIAGSSIYVTKYKKLPEWRDSE